MQKLSLLALDRVLSSLDATRNGAALYALLASFCLAGLLLASAESALAREALAVGGAWALAALAVAFLGVNATGLLLMDQALGRPPREVADAFYASLRLGPRVIAVLLAWLIAAALLVGLVLLLLAGARLPHVGPLLLTATVPLAVPALGLAGLVGVLVVGPLSGPSVWAGRGVVGTLRWQRRQLRRLVDVLALMALVLLLTGLLSAAVSAIVIGGGRALAALGVWGLGLELSPQALMAGLFGHGLRSLGAGGAPAAPNALNAAANIGGGVVFALALVLPTLIYLRGCCAVYLALQDGE